MVIFFLKNCEKLFCIAEARTHFWGKIWQRLYVYYIGKFNVSLTNDVVSFEQLGLYDSEIDIIFWINLRKCSLFRDLGVKRINIMLK